MSEHDFVHVDKHVKRKYDVGVKLGKGAYGIVWRAEDHRTKQTVALKKIFDAFQNATDAQRTYREIVYLQQMDHENIVKLLQVMKADNDRDIYLVFEFMETDLHSAIRASILEDIHKQYIIYQSFLALSYIHARGLVHRDMKPANLLLNSDCLMKVADFGLARSVQENRTNEPLEGNGISADQMTDYVATRWYRAPEILVGSDAYGVEVDMWSMGCILAEMLLGTPVFSGTSTLNQLEKFGEVLGAPTDADRASWRSKFTEAMAGALTTAAPKPSSGLGASYTAAAPATVKHATAASATTSTSGATRTPSRGTPSYNSSSSSIGTNGLNAAREVVGALEQTSDLLGPWLKQRLSELRLPPPEATAIALLNRLLRYNPGERIQADEGKRDQYCRQFHIEETEKWQQRKTRVRVAISDNTKEKLERYREGLYEYIKASNGKSSRGGGGFLNFTSDQSLSHRPKHSHRSTHSHR